MLTLTPPARLVADALALIESLSPQQLAAELAGGRAVLVDLREQDERARDGSIPGAHHLPRGLLEFRASGLDPASRIVVHCQTGMRSALGAATLLAMGFPDVAHLDGGFEAWCAAGGEVQR